MGLPIINSGKSPANVTHLQNLLSVVECIFQDQKSGYEIYDVVDNEFYPASIGDYLSALMKKFNVRTDGIHSMSIAAARYVADLCEQQQDPSSQNMLPFSRLLLVLLGDSPYVEGKKVASLLKDRKKVVVNLEQGLSMI
jgi:hypothetical protein